MTSAPEHRPRRFDREVDGILLLDKPLGLSSNAALQEARRAFRALKAGHAGSLDPLASGLLPVCFGQATKVCGQLLESGKTYRVGARLGVRTATADAEGEVVECQPVPPLDRAFLEPVLERFLGEQTQVPPMYSALKHEGQPLYRLARRGQIVERAPRRIHIDRLVLLAVDNGGFELEVACSKGTYIRTLVEDIARALGTVGHVVSLRRVGVDAFGDHPMVTMGELMARVAEGDEAGLAALLLPVDHVFAGLPRVVLDADGEEHLRQGRRARPVGTAVQSAGGRVRVYGPAGSFLGLAEVAPDGALQPVRLFVRGGPCNGVA